jgi:DMSO reductase iron-sulfur subunit
VYEVSGGGWHSEGGAWHHDAFAYNLAIACNHCDRPICVEVCPTQAMYQRADGLVLMDEQRCLGCHYCEWACPYGAPQYQRETGVMSKCTGCADELPLGKAPACVAACGLRALDFGPEGVARQIRRRRRRRCWSPARPNSWLLPIPRRRPAAAAGAPARGAAAQQARCWNPEEVQPSRAEGFRSLVAFTLLGQLAVGLYWACTAALGERAARGGCAPAARRWPSSDRGVIACCCTWPTSSRVACLANLRQSWLSREILFVGLFALGWLGAVLLARAAPARGSWHELVFAAIALLGLGLVSAMARVYRLRTVPAWDTVRTLRSFLLTALVLGGLGASLLLGLSRAPGVDTVGSGVLFVLAVVAAGVARLRFYARRERTAV